MAYKFQFGPATLSGSTTFEETITGSSYISASKDLAGRALLLAPGTMAGRGAIGIVGDADLLTLTANTVTVAGAANSTTTTVTGLASLDGGLDVNGTFTVSDTGQVAGATTITGSGALTVLNVTTDKVTAADVSGPIGVSAQNSVKATTLSASSTLHAGGVVTAGNGFFTVSATGDVDINGGAIDGTTIGATSATTGIFTSATAPILLGDMTGSGALDLMGAASFGNSRLVVNENAVLVTAPLHVSGTFALEEAMTAVKLAQDGMLYFDSGSGTVHRSSLVDVASSMAGTGITATAGVLSVDTTGGDSMSATVINAIAAANDGFTLTTGLNFLTAEVSGSSAVTLPSGSSGDVVIVKADLITGAGNLKISSSLANANQIDGFSEARIESSYGAVSLVYTVRAGDAHGDWVIY